MVAPEIASKDSAMRAFAKNLRETQRVLEQTLEDYEGYRKGKHPKTSNSTSDGAVGIGDLDLSEILTYAHKISYTTFAPPEFGAGQAALRGAIPPAPQDEQMRASLLYQYADLDVGIPKQTITEPLPVAIVEPAPEKVVVNPMPEVVSGTLPPMPPGWRPGMPIELPAIPAGWKPGDPVPLPPAMEVPAGWKPGDVVLLPKTEETAPSLPMPVAPPRPAEPIQVRYVQLDINPEAQDDDSSEYTTEEGSSEEEDD